jgi:hypothetical protein
VKYFTRDLIEMGLSQDSQVLGEWERLWDERGDKYVAYLDTIRAHFPPGLRQMDENYYLHDAVIGGMGQRNRTFVIMLQLDTPPHSLVTFTYDLTADPAIICDTLAPDQHASPHYVEWLYDEIESVPGEPPTWIQSILLTNGWEVRLHFRDLTVQEMQTLIPVPRKSRLIGGTAPMSQSA